MKMNPFEFKNKLHDEFQKQHNIRVYDKTNNKTDLLQYIVWLEELLMKNFNSINYEQNNKDN